MKAIHGSGVFLLGALALFGCGTAEPNVDEAVGETQSALTNARFSAWSALPAPPAGKQFNGAVEATSSWQRRQFADVFTKVFPDERIYVTSRNLNTVGGSWPAWQGLPTNVAIGSSPSAATLPNCKTMVAAIGTDSRIYVTSRANNCSNAVNGAGWSNWVAATGPGYDAAPAIAASSAYVMLVARQGTNLVWWYSVTGGASFEGPMFVTAVPGGATASPDLAPDSQGQSNNFFASVRSSNQKSYVLFFDEPDFSWQATWREAPGLYSAGPTYLPSVRTLFGKGTDVPNGVWQTTGITFSPAGWSTPAEIGNIASGASNPGAVDRTEPGFSTKVDVFQRTDGFNVLWSAYR